MGSHDDMISSKSPTKEVLKHFKSEVDKVMPLSLERNSFKLLIVVLQF